MKTLTAARWNGRAMGNRESLHCKPLPLPRPATPANPLLELQLKARGRLEYVFSPQNVQTIWTPFPDLEKQGYRIHKVRTQSHYEAVNELHRLMTNDAVRIAAQETQSTGVGKDAGTEMQPQRCGNY